MFETRTVITANCTGQVFLKILRRIMLLILSAESGSLSVHNPFDGSETGWHSHAIPMAGFIRFGLIVFSFSFPFFCLSIVRLGFS